MIMKSTHEQKNLSKEILNYMNHIISKKLVEHILGKFLLYFPVAYIYALVHCHTRLPLHWNLVKHV